MRVPSRKALGLPPAADYWRARNRQERLVKAYEREARKENNKYQKKCTCLAYAFPHRLNGGLCRFPEPPLVPCERKPRCRPYRKRYAGLRRQIARANGWHPIRDRKKIEEEMPKVLYAAKELKRQCPKVKYKNMEVRDGNKLTGYYWRDGNDWEGKS